MRSVEVLEAANRSGRFVTVNNRPCNLSRLLALDNWSLPSKRTRNGFLQTSQLRTSSGRLGFDKILDDVASLMDDLATLLEEMHQVSNAAQFEVGNEAWFEPLPEFARDRRLTIRSRAPRCQHFEYLASMLCTQNLVCRPPLALGNC